MTALLSIDVGRKNLALCCLEPGADPHGRDDLILHWAVVSTLPTCVALTDTLRLAGVLDWLPGVRDVVIERQPGKNAAMVRIMCYLEMFFTTHGKFVTLADSRQKLNFAAASPYWPGGVPDNWTYYTRKKLAVQTMAAYLAAVPQPEGVADTFAKSQKKDDLADSALQGMAYAHFTAALENARAQAQRGSVPAPRRPSAKQLASGKLTKANVVSLVRDRVGSADDLEAACAECKPLRKAIAKHFGSLEYCRQALATPDEDAAGASA